MQRQLGGCASVPDASTPGAGPVSGTTMVATAPDSRVADRLEPRLEARRRDIAVAARTFASMAAFLVLVAFAGYLAAALIFTPMFLLYTARAKPRTVIIYTLVLGAVLLSLPSLLPVELPLGILQ